MQAVAHVTTAHASRYLQQLCKHWSHKFPVTFTAEHGRVELPVAVLEMDAAPDALALRLEAPDDQIERMQGVVADHVRRFAFKEDLQFAWTTG
jgi:hypothetical protein